MNNLEIELGSRILHFSKKNNIQIGEESLGRLTIGQRHEIEDTLSSIFEPSGKIFYSETGMSARTFLPELISSYLEMLPDNHWVADSIESDDEWMSAKVTLVNREGEHYDFNIEEVNDSDWVPADFSKKLNTFSKNKFGMTFVEFYSDDPYLVMVLPNDVAAELNSIIEEFSEPY